jgi:sugar lactone lactonase YvrE
VNEVYYDSQIEFGGESGENTWSIFKTYYNDDQCENELMSEMMEGTYELVSNSPANEDWDEVAMNLTSIRYLPYHAEAVELLNASNCGSDWSEQTPQDVQECEDFIGLSADCSVYYNFISIKGGELHLAYDGISAEICQFLPEIPTATDSGKIPLANTLEINQDDYYPEGIAMEPYGRIYVGAVGLFSGAFGNATTEGTVTAFSRDGYDTSRVIPPSDNDAGAVGMQIKDGTLWYCSLIFGAFESELVAYDLDNREELARYPLGPSSFCNDLTISASGDVYVTDSFGRVLKYSAADELFEVWSTDPALAPLPQDQGGFIGANGITMSPDESAVIVGTSDTANLVQIEIAMDGSAGEVIEHVLPEATTGGIDGLVEWRGMLYAVRDNSIQRIAYRDDAWEIDTLVELGVIDSPTTLAIDHFGNMWIVASQFQYLFDGDDTTFGSTPFEVVRIPLRSF